MAYKISNNIIENLDFIEKLADITSFPTRSLIQNAAASQILSIVEICNNILNYNITLTYPQKIKLAKYAAFYRNIARCSLENKARKCILKGLDKEKQEALSILVNPVLKSIKEKEDREYKSELNIDLSTCVSEKTE